MITDEMCRRAYLAAAQASDVPAIRAALEAVEADIRRAALEDVQEAMRAMLRDCDARGIEPGRNDYFLPIKDLEKVTL